MKTPAKPGAVLPWVVPPAPIAPVAFRVPPAPAPPAEVEPDPRAAEAPPVDAVLAGLSPEAREYVEKTATPSSRKKTDTGAARVLALAREAGFDVVRCRSTGRPLAVVAVGPRRAVLDADGLRDHLSALAVGRGLVVTGGALADASRAVLSLPSTPASVHVRLGDSDDGARLYLDLGDDSGAAVEVDGAGWRVVLS